MPEDISSKDTQPKPWGGPSASRNVAGSVVGETGAGVGSSGNFAGFVVGGMGAAVEELSLKLNSWTDRQASKRKQRELEPHATLYCQF